MGFEVGDPLAAGQLAGGGMGSSHAVGEKSVLVLIIWDHSWERQLIVGAGLMLPPHLAMLRALSSSCDNRLPTSRPPATCLRLWTTGRWPKLTAMKQSRQL